MIEIKGLNVNVGSFHLRDISFRLGMAEYFVLLGPTGTGKTVLIETVAGMHRPRNGQILISGIDVTRLAPERRGIGYVPQDYALFPNMNVGDNIAFALRVNAFSGEVIGKEVQRLAKVFGIEQLLERIPHTLSGGEKQRVALARALAARPSMLLLDEPLAALDKVSRTSLSMELKRVQKRFEVTILHVTHDLEEAFTLSDRVGVMMDGMLIQCGSPREVFYRPKNRKVAEFVGVKNIFGGEVLEVVPEEGETRVLVDGVVIRAPLFTHRKGEKVLLCIRPEEIMLIKPDRPVRRSLKENAFSGTILDMIERNSTTLLVFLAEDEALQLYVEVPNHVLERWGLVPGKGLTVSLKKPSIWLTAI